MKADSSSARGNFSQLVDEGRIAGSFNHLLDNTVSLFRNEARLAKLKAEQRVQGFVYGMALKAAGSLMLVMSLLFLATSAVFGIRELLEASFFVSFLIVGSALALIGTVLALVVSKRVG